VTPQRRLERWVETELGLRNASAGARLGGGNSNVTQLIRHDDGLAVLRRPPDDTISPSAGAGVTREYGMLKALHGHVKVPRPLGYCDDLAVAGHVFSVIEHVPGVAISETLPAGYAHDAATVSALGTELVDALAAVHRVDWRALGMRAPEAPERYVAKQIARLRKLRAEESGRPLPLIEELARWLTEKLPEPPPATVIHGDYHLDNTLFSSAAPELKAIIDWELATIGDPYADLGLLLAFWGPRSVEPPGFAFVQKVSRMDGGVIGRRALAERWSARTGLDLEPLDAYIVFALWRLASIVEGAYILYQRGRVDSDYARGLEHDVPAMLEEAADIAFRR
jgi:aminoglycoside phosphotransferase (APT) family kinase protein